MKILRNYFIVIFSLVGGLIMAYHPMIFSGFADMQTDPGDTRLNNYILEHSYRWLLSLFAPQSYSYWDFPVFYPAQNIAAYSDILLGVAPFYWVWRLVGFLPDTAFQFWMLTVSSLNFLAAYLLFRKCFDLNRLPSSFGAFLFAFGSPRVAQIGHQQLIAHFFTIMVFYALYKIFVKSANDSKCTKRSFWIVIFFISLTAQLYAGFYLGWFLLLSLSVAFFWTICIPNYRNQFLFVCKSNVFSIFAALLLSVLVLFPMITHYKGAVQEVRFGFRDFSMVENSLPYPRSWIDMGEDNWIYGWTDSFNDVFDDIEMRYEKTIGLGLVTPVIILFGFYWRRHFPGVKLLLLVFLTLLILVTRLPDEWLSLWEFVYNYFPGAKAIRGVSRIGILMLIPASLGIAFFFQRMQRKKVWVICILAMFFIVEQGNTTASYNKDSVRAHVAAITKMIDPRCKAFFYSPIQNHGFGDSNRYHLDAMWAQMESGVPTLNGYSGNSPEGWYFDKINIQNGKDEKRVASALVQWLTDHNLNRDEICWIKPVMPDDYKSAVTNKFSENKLKTIIKISPKNGEAYIELGERYIDEWRFEEAYEIFKKGIELNPENIDIYRELAEYYEKQGDYDQEEKMLRKIEEIFK